VEALVVGVCGCGADKPTRQGSPSGVRSSRTVFHALDLALRRQVELSGMPGASAAVVFADGHEWAGAAGDARLKPRQAMSTRTSLPFDSVTKLAVAALALRLAEQGRLRLDDPIGR
jgi:D-alanyl-D-alanine carboxypeptidase